MKQAGAGQRQLQQAALDIQKQQWEQQQQQPERQIAWMNQQLGALPYQNIVQQGTYTPQAGTVSSLLGAGIQGAGLWNAWQGRQRPWQRSISHPGVPPQGIPTAYDTTSAITPGVAAGVNPPMGGGTASMAAPAFTSFGDPAVGGFGVPAWQRPIPGRQLTQPGLPPASLPSISRP